MWRAAAARASRSSVLRARARVQHGQRHPGGLAGEYLAHKIFFVPEKARRGEALNLRVDELAFYDALADNPTAEAVLGDQILKQIAHELVESVRKNTSIDWPLKESVQAKLRVLVKRILRKYKYPPDDPSTGEYTVSVNKVLDQAELLADFWTRESKGMKS